MSYKVFEREIIEALGPVQQWTPKFVKNKTRAPAALFIRLPSNPLSHHEKFVVFLFMLGNGVPKSVILQWFLTKHGGSKSDAQESLDAIMKRIAVGTYDYYDVIHGHFARYYEGRVAARWVPVERTFEEKRKGPMSDKEFESRYGKSRDAVKRGYETQLYIMDLPDFIAASDKDPYIYH